MPREIVAKNRGRIQGMYNRPAKRVVAHPWPSQVKPQHVEIGRRVRLDFQIRRAGQTSRVPRAKAVDDQHFAAAQGLDRGGNIVVVVLGDLRGWLAAAAK